VRADDGRVLVAHEPQEAQSFAAARQLDDVGIDRRAGIALDDPFVEPAVVQGRGEAVGIAALGGHGLGEVHELVRGLRVEAVAQRVVDLVVRRRGELPRVSGAGAARRIVKSLESKKAHGSSSHPLGSRAYSSRQEI
jgi:hypothetical protein